MKSQLFALALFLAEQPGTGIEGRWSNPKGSVIVAIGPCGERACGRVAWASEKAIADARKGGTASLLGTALLQDIVPQGATSWRARLFVPDLNRTSKVRLRLLDQNMLEVTGCALGRVICKSQVWKRLPGE